MDEEEKINKMDDGITRYFTRFGQNLFVDAALSLGPRMI